MGITSALVFCNLGAAYGTAKSGVGIASVGVLKSDLVFKSLIPIIMAGILGIYGLIVSVILQGKSKYLRTNEPSSIRFCVSDIPNFYFSQLDTHRIHHYPHCLVIQCFQRLQAPRLRPLLRSFIPRCRSLHRCCWWRWCPCQRSEGHLRRSYSYSHLRWGPRSVWFDYLHHSVLPLHQLLIKLSKYLRLVSKHVRCLSVALTAIRVID